jgi:hypothetical protein
MMDGTYTTGLISVNADAILGGSGTVGDVSFVETGRLLFNASLSIADTYQVTFASPESFGLDNLVDAAGNPYSVWSAVVAPGTYTLLSGNVDWTGIDPVSADENNPLDIGNGKTAYLKQSSLQLVVIPEPGSLGALGLIALATILRRRLRR